MPDVLEHATPVSNALERVGDVLPEATAAPERRLTPERLGDFVDAKDTISSIQEARKHPLAYRLLNHALPAAAVGGFGLGAKGGLWSASAGNTDLSTAARNGLGFGAAIGGATGVGLELADTLSQKRRLARARGVIGHAPRYVKERLKDPEVQDYARSYQSARSFPTRLTELGILAGGVAGSAYGIGSTPIGGPTTHVPLFDVNLSNSQLSSAGKWGLIGSAGVGAAGLLGGLVMRRMRRKRLLAALDQQKTAAEVTREPFVTLMDGTKVFIVSGMDVRNTKSPEFIGGGHDLVYDYVPKGEIWLDDEVDEADRPFILFHEIYERNLMAQGWDYDRAHNSANKLEGKLRKRKQSKHVAE